MKKNEIEKIRKRQYISMYIDRYLLVFFGYTLAYILFGPYKTLDYTNFNYYIPFFNGFFFTLLFQGRSILRLIKFIKNKEKVPDEFRKCS